MKRKIVGYAIHYCDYGGLDVAYTFDADVPGGCIVWARYGDGWHINSGARWAVRLLLEAACTP